MVLTKVKKCGNIELLKWERGVNVGLFKVTRKETRSIEEMLTPKDVIKDEEEAIEGEGDVATNSESEVKSEPISEEKVEADTPNSKNIQVETPEEVSFNALTCFGWSETKTPKWLIKCAHFWYGAMSFFWFIFGAMTFAPIIFMQKKINVVFNDKLRSFMVSSVIYIGFLALLVVLFLTRNNGTMSMPHSAFALFHF